MDDAWLAAHVEDLTHYFFFVHNKACIPFYRLVKCRYHAMKKVPTSCIHGSSSRDDMFTLSQCMQIYSTGWECIYECKSQNDVVFRLFAKADQF